MRLVNFLRKFLLLVFLARSLSFLADWCSSRFATTQLLPIPSLNPVKIVETFQIIYAQRAGYLLGAVPFGQLALRWDDNKPFLTTPLWKNIFEMGFSFHWRFASFFFGGLSRFTALLRRRLRRLIQAWAPENDPVEPKLFSIHQLVRARKSCWRWQDSKWRVISLVCFETLMCKNWLARWAAQLGIYFMWSQNNRTSLMELFNDTLLRG